MKNIRKSLIAVAVLASFPLHSMAASCGTYDCGKDQSSDEDVSITETFPIGIFNESDRTIEFTGKSISVVMSSQDGNLSGVLAMPPQGATFSPIILLGGPSTEKINIDLRAEKGHALGLRALSGGKLEVNTKTLDVSVHSETGWAYAIHAQGSSNSNTSLVINADNISVEASSGVEGQGTGLAVFSKANLTIEGNLTVKADDVLATRGDAITRINESGKGIVKLYGDIDYNYDEATSKTSIDADVLINLNNADSIWEGSAYYSWDKKPAELEKLNVGKFQLLVQNGAQWTPSKVQETESETAGLLSLAVNNLTLNDGVINIGSTDQVVKVQNISGSGGTINTAASITDGQNVTAGKFEVEAATGAPKLTVNAVGVDADDVTNSEAAMESFYASALGENSPVKEATLNIAEGDVSGALSGQMTNGVLTTTEVANTVNSSLIDIASSNYLFFRSQINDVSARLGDLRSMPKTAGAWVRYYGGENKYSGKDMKEKYHTLQIGADKFINDNFYLGGTFSYTKGDGTLANGSTDDKNFNFGIYGGWMGEKGQFVDVIIKRHRLKSDFDLYSGNGVSSGNFHNWATSVSVEAGWRFNCPSNGFYAEPQVELQVGHVDSANYTTSRGVKVKQKGIDSVIGRAGVAVGYSFPENKGNAYAMASVLHDWKGEVKSTFGNASGQSRTYSEDLGGTWGEFALGGTYNPTKNVSAYGQFKTSTGSPVRNPWQVSVGLRYNF